MKVGPRPYVGFNMLPVTPSHYTTAPPLVAPTNFIQLDVPKSPYLLQGMYLVGFTTSRGNRHVSGWVHYI